MYLWSSMLWITSLSNSRLTTNQKNMSQNKKNMIPESIALIYAMARNDVLYPKYLTTEPNEHVFQSICPKLLSCI